MSKIGKNSIPPFIHPKYTLVDGDKFQLNDPSVKLTFPEEEELIKEIGHYVEARMISAYGFVAIPIPGEDSVPSTSILASPDWQTASKLLLIIQNSPGSMMGVFSRSLCLDQGLSKGSMLPYIDRAIAAEYAVMILRPNTNSVLQEVEGEGVKKVPITGSETPEIHALCVWENVVSKAESTHIALLGYANGAHLMKDLYLNAVVKSDNDIANNKIKAFITIEASHILEDDDPADIHDELGKIAVNLECNTAPKGYRLGYRKQKLGCTSISLGLPVGSTEVTNVAASISLALAPVFKYLQISEGGGEVFRAFSEVIARDNGHNPANANIFVNPRSEEDDELSALPPTPLTISKDNGPASEDDKPPAAPSSSPTPNKPTLLRRISAYIGIRNSTESDKSEESAIDASAKLTVNDFDLLKIVGKGAFGKVLLVRKKKGNGVGRIYAMKVLKKSMIVEKNQVEHAKSERDILFEIKHPYIVRLRFAFQSDDKLYLVTDYYNGGTLFYHLRKSLCFTESRARFYAAELLLALDHLHSQHIIYRDLKLENVLLDHLGHVALTDFGLSKQNFDKSGGATTFCGTPDYVAPELLKGLKYGKAVDWWSFGVLLFEMIQGQTPFFDKNRKVMFQRIVSSDVVIPSNFSNDAGECIRGLLTRNSNLRLGSSGNGVLDIMGCSFFSPIDFVAMMKKEVQPTFKPDVVNELDTKYVPKFFLDTKVADSVSEPSKSKGKDDTLKFEAFTFQGDSAM